LNTCQYSVVCPNSHLTHVNHSRLYI